MTIVAEQREKYPNYNQNPYLNITLAIEVEVEAEITKEEEVLEEINLKTTTQNLPSWNLSLNHMPEVLQEIQWNILQLNSTDAEADLVW